MFTASFLSAILMEMRYYNKRMAEQDEEELSSDDLKSDTERKKKA